MSIITRVSGTAIVLAIAGAASAQSFNSFVAAEALRDVTVHRLGAGQFQVTVGANPEMERNGTLYPIESIFGFWAVSPDTNLVGSTTGFGVWSSNSNSAGPGSILGWRTNPNTGLTANSQVVFIFDPGTVIPNTGLFGFHVRLAGGVFFPGTTGNTGHVYVPAICYPDCKIDHGGRALDVFDFLCFQNLYEIGDPYACDCDTTTGVGVCDLFDFLCYQNAFQAGCP